MDFETKHFLLVQRYIKTLPRKQPPSILCLNNHNSLLFYMLLPLIETSHLTHSYFSSPLTCPNYFTQYYSPHNRGTLFGSLVGPCSSFQWTCNGYACLPRIKIFSQKPSYGQKSLSNKTHKTLLFSPYHTKIGHHTLWNSYNIPTYTKSWPFLHSPSNTPFLLTFPHTTPSKNLFFLASYALTFAITYMFTNSFPDSLPHSPPFVKTQ